MRTRAIPLPMLEPDAPAWDDTAERDDERIDCVFANGHHLRRLHGLRFDQQATATAAPPWGQP